MHDVIEQALGFARGAWRFRWFVFVIVWPIAIGGWVFVSKMPDEYQASARVFVDTRSLLNPLLQGLAIQNSSQSEIQLIANTIYSRPNLEKIIRMTDMDLQAKNDQEMELILDKLKAKLTLSSGGRGGDSLYKIAYTDDNPQLAKATVQALLTIFVESTLGDKRKNTDNAQKFIDEQIREYEQRLTEAENKLRDFKRKNLGMSGSVEGHYSQLEEVKRELKSVQLTKRESEQRRDELERQLEELEEDGSEGDSLDFLDEAVGSIYDTRIQSLEMQKEELLIRYTERHPQVISIDKTIESLQERAKLETPAEAPRNTGIESNPVYQQLKMALGEADANLASLNVRENEYQARVNDLIGKIDRIPLIETELQRLNRDYSVDQRNYNALVARRESAKLGEEAEQSGDILKFRVIDPPFVGNQPVAPNRPLMISIVFIGALLAGLAFPVFLSLIKPCVDTVKSLQDLTGLPVIGGVSLIRNQSQIVRRRVELLSFLFMVGLVFTAYAGVMTLTFVDADITQIIGEFL